MNFLPDLIGNNQFATGGLVMGATVGLVALFRRSILALGGWLKRRFVAEVVVRDPGAVTWFGLFLANTEYGQRARRSEARVRWEGDDSPAFHFEPGIGMHAFRYKGSWYLIEFNRGEKGNGAAVDPLASIMQREWYSIRVIGDRRKAERLLEEAKRVGLAFLSKRNTAYVSDGKGYWDRVAVGAPRTLESVVLPQSTIDAILPRIIAFRDARDWYASVGIPHRLGVALYGPPGTGKTSLVRALANHLQMPLYVLKLAIKDFDDNTLAATLSRVPPGAVVVLEDIDVEFNAKGSLITLSGLLNALDGPLATEGRVLFITTNAIENIDPALLRAGRIDVRIHVGYATREQARGMFLRFFPNEEFRAEQFAANVPEEKLPPSDIQEYLLRRSDDPARAVAEVSELAAIEVALVSRGEAA